jgi:GT2 family glycosyltransferase
MRYIPDQPHPRVSFVIATFNRKQILLRTLRHVQGCGLPASEFETLVVDNASTDGTADAVTAAFPKVRLIRLDRNQGPCAKNVALREASSDFIVFLDDDSYPQVGSVWKMLRHFEWDTKLGAAVFTIHLPNGARECSAYPDVCIGCGTGFRREALDEVGGLPQDFFMAAEEYDLSLRLLGAGWAVQTFEDLHVTHLKIPTSRFPSRVARLDARNNVMLALRYFPDRWRMRYAAAWLQRYQLMAQVNGNLKSFYLGAVEGIARGLRNEYTPIDPAAFERFSRIEQIHSQMSRLATKRNWQKLLLVDLGKNFIAWHDAAERLGLQIVGIADQRLGGRGLRYGGIPLLSDEQAMMCGFSAAVISNLSPVHADERLWQWRRRAGEAAVDLVFGANQRSAAATPLLSVAA